MNNIKKKFPFDKYINHDILLVGINNQNDEINFYLNINSNYILELITYNTFNNYYTNFYDSYIDNDESKDTIECINSFLEPKHIYTNNNKNLILLYCLDEDINKFNDNIIKVPDNILLEFINTNNIFKNYIYNFLDIYNINYKGFKKINILLLKVFSNLLKKFITNNINIYGNIKINIDSDNKYKCTNLQNDVKKTSDKYNILYYFLEFYSYNKYLKKNYHNCDTCSICLDKFDNKQIIITNCCHIFHKECYLDMIKSNNIEKENSEKSKNYLNNIKCPDCRTYTYTYMVLTVPYMISILEDINKK